MHITDARTLSRRSFMAATGISAAALFASRGLFAEETGIVPTMMKAAAGARIEIHPLRRAGDAHTSALPLPAQRRPVGPLPHGFGEDRADGFS